jgi:hypothetical protein
MKKPLCLAALFALLSSCVTTFKGYVPMNQKASISFMPSLYHPKVYMPIGTVIIVTSDNASITADFNPHNEYGNVQRLLYLQQDPEFVGQQINVSGYVKNGHAWIKKVWLEKK